MRITGGKYKGRIISGSPGTHVRPTTDRARESLFNILWNSFDLDSANVLDLFSGTGLISLECLSRNCRSVVSVDMNFQSVLFQKKLHDQFKPQQPWDIRKADVLRYCEKEELSKFEFIFMDPPYNWPHYQTLISLICSKISPNALLVVEHDSKLTLIHPALQSTRIYGQSAFSFFSIN
jgi:16S rRNA (guanine966-N2)-methyltransferase